MEDGAVVAKAMVIGQVGGVIFEYKDQSDVERRRAEQCGLVWSGLVSVQLLAPVQLRRDRLLMGDFWFGLAGEVLFAEVLVTPTGQSKGCGCVFHSYFFCRETDSVVTQYR